MKTVIDSAFLVFPVNTLGAPKKLSFFEKDKKVYEISIKLDNINPDFYAFIDVSRFMGKELDISVFPQMDIKYRKSDEIDLDVYNEPLRPQVHFTTKNGWINDPNGMIYIDGVYHLFYQHNPADSDWENMQWGHAVSNDMIHWKEEKVVLFPDNRGTMFSGSAILDKDNLLGKNTDTNVAALLFYTTTDPFCQNVSYSTDNFKTVEHLAANPVVPNIVGSNRDPKVMYCEELGCYIMALYLEDDVYCILKSDNLTDWEELQRISIKGDNECPDIFPLSCENESRKWVLMGAHDKYIVGEFRDGKFVPLQDALTLTYGCSSYAGQSFNNLPGDRVVRIVWNRWNIPAHTFNGQMGIPGELALQKIDGTYYLKCNPINEIESIYDETSTFENVPISKDCEFSKELKFVPHLIKLKGDISTSNLVSVRIFGRELKLYARDNKMWLGNDSAPIWINGGELDLTILVDRCSIEIFSDGGKVCVSSLAKHTVADQNLPFISISSNDDVNIDSLGIISLNSIWE